MGNLVVMHGPKPLGFWSGRSSKPWGPLVPGRHYRVARAFVDHDRVDHPVGERWQFLGSSFLPHDNGVMLLVSLDGQNEWSIRLQLDPDEQKEISDNIERYLDEVSPGE